MHGQTQIKKILGFIYPIYNHNWRNINTVYLLVYITSLESKGIFLPSNKIHREVGRAKDLTAPRYRSKYQKAISVSVPSKM